jgi:hypothetical protein
MPPEREPDLVPPIERMASELAAARLEIARLEREKERGKEPMQPTMPTEATTAIPPANSTALAVPPMPAPAPTEARTRVTVEQLALLPDNERRTLWINSLVEAEVARQNYAQDRALAREFAICGQFDDIKGTTLEQAVATAMVKIQLGRAWGFNAADSIRYIYFTNGRPAVENEIVASKLQQAGYDWDVEWLEEEVQHKGKPWRRCVGCKLWLRRMNAQQRYEPMLDRAGEPISVAFTEGDADHAMIWEKGKQIPLSQKWNFVSWARDMYYWRTIGRVKKYHAPHVLRGAMLREEALEVLPADLPPRELPAPDAPPEAAPAEAAAELKRPKLRDRVMGQKPPENEDEGLFEAEEEPAQ